MAHRYFPHTEKDVEEMLDACHISNLNDLFIDIPESLLFREDYNLQSEKSESEVRDIFNDLFKKNKSYHTILAGGGYYFHEKPSVIPYLISRSEFLTAYTPYQPEISQGTLQYIFEFQSLMTQLTGMEISNASMYDGATATAEAMMMAVAHARKRNKVLVSSTVNPAIKKVISTYAKFHCIDIEYIEQSEFGTTSFDDFSHKIEKDDVAGVIVSTPNYYGILENYEAWSDLCHKHKALFIINCIPADLATIKSPDEWGADIACGDAQSLGIPLNYGGPYLGFICSSKALMRKIPGRIVGATKDIQGQRSFVLTLQAREQHIRREKATSNICSNQGIMALYVTIYISLLGLKGLQESNQIGYDGAHWLADSLVHTGKVELTFPDSPFFNEFCITFPSEIDRDNCFKLASQEGILPGILIDGNKLLIAVTESISRRELEKFIGIVKQI